MNNINCMLLNQSKYKLHELYNDLDLNWTKNDYENYYSATALTRRIKNQTLICK